MRAGEEHGRISIPGVEKQVPSLFTFQDEKFAFEAFFMHFIPALKASNMEMIHFLSDCPGVIYDMVLKVVEKYGRLEITGQNASKKTLKTGLKATVDFPSYNFEYLRGDLTKE